MRSFTNKVAVVTGAASGIGRALAQDLAGRGAHLALVDVQAEALESLAAELRKTGRNASVHVVDVSDRAAMEALPGEVVAAHGQVDLLVNNAGVALMGTLEEVSIEDFEWLFGINFWGVVYGCKFFLPHLKARPEAHVVNLSSLFGLIGLPSQIPYCASKFAVRGLSEGLWAELKASRVGVTSVHPGGIQTNIVRAARGASDEERARTQELFDARGMPPEKAAARILRAVERNQLRLRIAPETVVIDWIKRLFPSGIHRLVEIGFRRNGGMI